MSKIYIVMASHGEYSDRAEWAVCYYTDEELAQKHVLLADKWEKKLQAEMTSREPAWNAVHTKARELFQIYPYDREEYFKRDKYIKEHTKDLKDPYKVREDMPNPYSDSNNGDSEERSFYIQEAELGPVSNLTED